MATNFPTSLDSYTTKVDGTDYPQAAHVNNPQDAIVALETKVGINSSGVTTTHDYKIAQLESGRALTGGSNATGTWGIAISGNAATASAVAASGITGATLASNVTASSLTSIAAGATVGGIEIGFRRLPAASVTTGAFVVADSGKIVNASAGVTVPNSTMAAGDVVTIYNNTAGAITITATITTLRHAGTTNTGNRTLAARGMASIYFLSSTEAIINGAGLS